MPLVTPRRKRKRDTTRERKGVSEKEREGRVSRWKAGERLVRAQSEHGPSCSRRRQLRGERIEEEREKKKGGEVASSEWGI